MMLQGLNGPDDDVPPPPQTPPAGAEDPQQLKVVQLNVSALQADNTLGLLLHGTTVVGFRVDEARHVGWKVGDKIIEVRGNHVNDFDEFMEFFQECQQTHGFPMEFSVLR